MRPIRMCLLALAAVGVVSAGAAATASAAVPEFGHCVKVAPKTGEYEGSNCTKPLPGTGKFNWVPGPGPKPKFSGIGELIELETVGGKKIGCGGATFSGEYTGAKTETVTVDLIGCVFGPTGQQCQSNPAQEGEIESAQPLEGEIGYIVKSLRPKVGIDLKPKSPATSLFTFQCGKPPETTIVLGNIEGSVIASIAKINKAVPEFALTYKAIRGIQKPQQFEGGAKDTLSLHLVSGLTNTTEETGLRALGSIENEEPIEIKALPIA